MDSKPQLLVTSLKPDTGLKKCSTLKTILISPLNGTSRVMFAFCILTSSLQLAYSGFILCLFRTLEYVSYDPFLIAHLLNI